MDLYVLERAFLSAHAEKGPELVSIADGVNFSTLRIPCPTASTSLVMGGPLAADACCSCLNSYLP